MTDLPTPPDDALIRLRERFAALRSDRLGPPAGPHETRTAGVLRPVVFGANDGLVSNLALIMGVAGAAPEPSFIVLAGIAGLLAGAFSMAVGEYVSVAAQREMLQAQVHLERRQLETEPEKERAILIGLFREKGFSEAEASAVAGTVFADPELALSTMVREEIGMDMKSIGSPMVAATGSFIAFVLGAIIPVIPYLLTSGTAAFVASLALGLVALFFLGVAISRFTGRSWLFSGARQVALGGVAAAVTYFVGAAIGATV
jgi:VIT1/CCC1 family predicted Fe2+/Mn2+ transporter